MNSKRIFTVMLWIPFLMEASFIPLFTIEIPGSPLTLGRICLVVLGIIGLSYNTRKRSPFLKVIILLIFGLFTGTLLSSDMGENFSAFIGTSLLLLSAYSASTILNLAETQKILTYYFYVVFIYWVIYVFGISLTGGKLESYGTIYRESKDVDSSLLNYHSFGLVLSVSMAYLSELNGWLVKIKPLGVLVILLGLVAIFITESRANLLITLAFLAYSYITNNKLQSKSVIKIIIPTVVVGLILSKLISGNENFAQRYDTQDQDYIDKTTASRFDFVGLSFEEMLQMPFGGGATNNRVNYLGTQFQPHNQYLTFILAAGIFGLVANIIWFSVFVRTTIRIARWSLNDYKPYLGALWITMLVMFTNDISGALFFLLIIFITWLSREVLKKPQYISK